MTTGESIALAVGGAAVVGGALYLLTRKPVAPVSSTVGTRPLAPAVGAGIVGLFSGLGSGLVNIFKGSGSTPTTAAIANQPIPNDAAAVQSWGAPVSLSQDASTLTSQGYTGVNGPTASEIELGIGPGDYY